MIRPLFAPVAVHKRRAETRDRSLVGAVRTYRASDGFEALIPEGVVDRLHTFATATAPHEWAGLLAGRRLVDDAGPYVVVEGVVPFGDTEADASNVATTPDGEARARDVLACIYPGAAPIGWAHSHPGHGLFLSRTDRRTQRTWGDHGLAIVVDHTIRERIFVACGADAVETDRVDGPVPPVRSVEKRAPVPTKAAPPETRKKQRSRRAIGIVGALLAAVLLVHLAVRSARRVVTRLETIERRIATLEAPPIPPAPASPSAASEPLVCVAPVPDETREAVAHESTNDASDRPRIAR